MKLALNLLPLACFAVLLIFFIGWNWFDWRSTLVLPWSIWLLVLFVCSLSWRYTTTLWVKRLNTLFFGMVMLIGILLVSGLLEIRYSWSLFVLAGFGSIHLYLYDIARTSTLYKGFFGYLLLVPMLLTVYAITLLYLFNGSLALAWIGLMLAVLFALTGLVAGYRR